jgi:hypothetical protein
MITLRKIKPNDTSLPPLRFDRNEVAGSLGDLGTFIPLLVGMVACCGLQLGPALIGTGVANVATGVLFRIPMPVQPMKAIAAVAIDEGMNESQIVIAGLVTGSIILVLGLTGLVGRFGAWIPRSVIRGIQLGLGLKLMIKGVVLITSTGSVVGWDSLGMGIVCCAIVLTLYSSRRVPAALIVFVIGVAALLLGSAGSSLGLEFGMAWHLPDLSVREDWWIGCVSGAVPQVPLTLLNSVVAVCALSADFFPKHPAPAKRVAVSVGLMNLIGCPLGVMPMCHGAGGLASQYRFGARTGGSVVMLGLVKIALGAALGASLFAWIQAYPESVLGALLAFGGLELILVCRDQSSRKAFLIMATTGAVCVAVNTAVGFAAGCVVAALGSDRLLRVDDGTT